MNLQKILNVNPARREVKPAAAKVRKPEYVSPKVEYRRRLVKWWLDNAAV